MNNPYKITVVGCNEKGRKIYGIVYKDPLHSAVGFPDSWGTKQHATNVLKDRLGIPHNERLP